MPRYVMEGFFMEMRVCLHRNLLARLLVILVEMLGGIFILNFRVMGLGYLPTICVQRVFEETQNVD